ncbi:MAG TPA: glycosyltransferase family 9 protein, partial [Ignavibacteriaceae bacterium]
HEFEFNLNLLKEIGINEKISENNTRFFLNIKSESLEKIKKMLTELEIVKNDKLVLIHPGSGGSAVDLPLQKMKELHKRISQLDNVKIIVTGSSDEIDICNLVNNNDSIFNLAGKLNLNELSALISLTDLFISNSTGPIHIAAALDRWIIGFYPKIPACSQNRWGPYTKKKYIFTPAIDCVNCSRQQCEKLDCMNTIDIGKVFEQARNVLIK